MSDLSRLKALASLPTRSFPFFGADPCHTPERENLPREECICGGSHVASNGRTIAHAGEADPIRDYEVCVAEHVTVGRNRAVRSSLLAAPLTVVCGCCLRNAHDGTQAMNRAFLPPLEDTESTALRDDTPRTDDGLALASSPGGTVLYDPRLEHRDNMRGGRLRGGLGDRPKGRKEAKARVGPRR